MKSLSSRNWNDLPDIDVAPSLNEEDMKCLEEIRKVLISHGREKVFGVNLLHKHFDLSTSEVLVESQDYENRTLLTRPFHVTELSNQSLRPTAWRFDENGTMVYMQCATGMYGDHYGYRD